MTDMIPCQNYESQFPHVLTSLWSPIRTIAIQVCLSIVECIFEPHNLLYAIFAWGGLVGHYCLKCNKVWSISWLGWNSIGNLIPLFMISISEIWCGKRWSSLHKIYLQGLRVYAEYHIILEKSELKLKWM